MVSNATRATTGAARLTAFGRSIVRHSGAAALLTYIAVSALLFGRGVLSDPSSYYVGNGPDPCQFMWYLVWWPWAILHRVNSVYTNAAWSPTGYNLAWATSIGAPSLAAAPVTLAFGPLVAYNALALLAPAITAWAGYQLCRHLTRSWWPSVAGGYVLGFSTYEIGHITAGHLHLTLFFVPPLLVLFGLRFLGGTLRARAFVLLFTSALILQFMISTEVFATATVCGAIVLTFAMLVSERRRELARLSGLVAASYGACALLLSPLLYWVFAFGISHEPIFPPALFSADLLAPLVPGPLTLFAPSSMLALAARFVSSTRENGAYIGLPLLAVSAAFCIERRRRAAGKLLAGILAIVFLLSLGPLLHIAGRPWIPLPWAAASRLPLLDDVLPVRMMSFAFIAVAAGFSMWLADASVSAKLRVVAAFTCFISILPRPLPDSIVKVETPAFFAQGLYRRYLTRDANVLMIPYGRNGDSMLWQAQSNMYFRMPGGYFNLIPPDFRRWSIINTLYTGTPTPNDGAQLKAFLAAEHVDAIVVADRKPAWSSLFASLGVEPHAVGGVDFYDLRRVAWGTPPTQSPAALEASADAAWFRELITAGGRYLAQGGAIESLSPTALRQNGLVPPARWIDNLEIVRAGWPPGMSNGLWIGPGRGGTVEVGLFGSREAVQPLIDTYGRDALATYYPYPSKFPGRAGDDEATHFLLMSFSADWVRRAALAESGGRAPAAAIPVSARR
jgi:hypothetical protein